jgi:hypothetical protein
LFRELFGKVSEGDGCRRLSKYLHHAEQTVGALVMMIGFGAWIFAASGAIDGLAPWI